MGQKFEIRSSSNPHQYVLLCNLIHHSWDFLLNLGWGHLLLVGVADASIGEDPFLSLPRTHEGLLLCILLCRNARGRALFHCAGVKPQCPSRGVRNLLEANSEFILL